MSELRCLVRAFLEQGHFYVRLLSAVLLYLLGAGWTTILYIFALVSMQVLYRYIYNEVSGAAHNRYHTNQNQKWGISSTVKVKTAE